MDMHIEMKQGTRLTDYESVIDLGISFAFQQHVDAATGRTRGHEALLRCVSGESAAEIIGSVRPENKFYFDQACRMRAIRDAARRGIEGPLHLNCTEVDASNLDLALSATLEAARRHGIDPDRIVLEFGSLHRLGNPRQLAKVRSRANQYGFRVLADNFGLGEAGLKRLAVLRPELVKLDRELIRNVHTSLRRQAMVHGIIATCQALGIEVIAAGVESEAEIAWLRSAGVETFQGFYYGRPSVADTQARNNGASREMKGLPSQFTFCAA